MTRVVELTLRCDGLSDLVLTDDAAFCDVNLDLGYPNPRVVSEPRPDQNGSDDTTILFGERAVMLEVLVQTTTERSVQASVDKLKAFLNPSRRPYLHFVLAGDIAERRVALRPNHLSDPLESPWWEDARNVQLGWVGPDGVIEAADSSYQVISATLDVEVGRVYDLTFDRVYPPAAPVGAEIVTLPSADDGAIAVPPILRLYGPCADPRIENVTTGQTIEFVGVTLLAGDYIEIDVRARTAKLDGTSSVYSSIDFTTSEWWELQPGDNLVRFYPVSFSAGAEAGIMWRAVWL